MFLTVVSAYLFIQKIEPGLQESESLYSLTYTVFFLGYTAAAIGNGLLFNLIPTWYLFLVAILSHTLGYLFYALCINGWMMLVARGLAGLSLGLSIAVTFAYFGVSSDKYAENLKILGKFEEKKVARVKGFIFSIYNIGNTTGFGFGGGKPGRSQSLRNGELDSYFTGMKHDRFMPV